MPIRIPIVENLRRRKKLHGRRRSGLLKKAAELSILCDAQITMFAITKTGKFFYYTSSSLSAKDVIERYQRTLGIDLWIEHYKCNEKDLEMRKETNSSLRRQIGQRTSGDYLDDLSFEELFALEQEMEASVTALRECKLRRIQVLVDVCKRKIKRFEWKREFLLPCWAGDTVHNGKFNDHRDDFVNALTQQLKESNLNDTAQTESCLTSNSNLTARNLDSTNELSSTQNLPDENIHI